MPAQAPGETPVVHAVTITVDPAATKAGRFPL